MLEDEEWSQWSNVKIAEQCAVDDKTVAKYRRQLEATSEIPKSTKRKGADGRTIDTSNIGSKSNGSDLPDNVNPETGEFLDSDEESE